MKVRPVAESHHSAPCAGTAGALSLTKLFACVVPPLAASAAMEIVAIATYGPTTPLVDMTRTRTR